jgi:hypothetical protein
MPANKRPLREGAVEPHYLVDGLEDSTKLSTNEAVSVWD